jgi:hypothetical protein
MFPLSVFRTPIRPRAHRRNVPAREALVTDRIVDLFPPLRPVGAAPAPNPNVHIRVAIVHCRTKVEARRRGCWKDLPPFFCFVYLFSPTLFNTCGCYPSRRNAEDRHLNRISPVRNSLDRTTPVICVRLETRVAPTHMVLEACARVCARNATLYFGNCISGKD